jgi:uncharacterized coiled-coil DUF342 family protein
MGKKEEYQAKIEAQLKEWGGKLEELKARAAKAGAEAKVELNKQIESLKAKQEAAQKKLKEVREAGGEAWKEVKKGLEKSVDDLKEAWGGVLSRFRKKGD